MGVSESTPEPTNADLAAQLAELTAFLNTAFSAVNANFKSQHEAIAKVAASAMMIEANQNSLNNSVAQHRGETRSGFESVARDLKRAQEGIAGVKSDTAFVERWNQDMHEALVRHIADPNAHPDAA